VSSSATGSSRDLASYYDAEAAVYEELWAPVLARPGRALLDALHLEDARVVVDVGTGVGALLPAIRAATPYATVIAVDRSLGMLRRASSTVRRVVADVAALGLRASVFDAAIMAFVLFHLADPLQALKQVGQVLRPGGMLGTLTWGREGHCPALETFSEGLDERHAPSNPCPARHELVNHPLKMTELLQRAGFEDVRSWWGWVEHRESRETFLRRITSGGSTGGALTCSGLPRAGSVSPRLSVSWHKRELRPSIRVERWSSPPPVCRYDREVVDLARGAA
jgi:ubiquinone/menaquinone biosynthesis C-methylase UbiE